MSFDSKLLKPLLTCTTKEQSRSQNADTKTKAATTDVMDGKFP
jgi:hypothetical protein